MKSKAPLLSLKTSGSFAGVLTSLNRKDSNAVQIWHKPKYKRTTAQAGVRAKFYEAKEAWKLLPENEKAQYNEIGDNLKNNRMTGYNYFLSVYLKQPIYDFLLMEDGSFLLLETGDNIIL